MLPFSKSCCTFAPDYSNIYYRLRIMSNFDELIMKRRSIRVFDAEHKVSKEQIEALVKAAIEAPSWNNFQTSRYHVVTSSDVKQQLGETMAAFDTKIASTAPVLIVTTFVKGHSGFKGGEAVDELGDGWGIYDLGLHNALLLLKAADAGLDTIVLGLRDADKIRTLLSIPEEESIVSIIALGYRAKDGVRPKRKAVEEITKFY